MDPNNISGRTNIIDDLDAIALAQQGQRKAPKNTATGPSTTAKASSSKPGPSKQPRAKQDGGDRAESSKPKPVKKTTKPMTFKHIYEKDDLKIPLYEKGGKKRLCARLAKTLRNKGTDILLDMVEAIAGVEKRREFKKADLCKQDIAEWIEMVETRALGRHPRSEHNFVKDDFVIVTEDLPMAQPEPAPAAEPEAYDGKDTETMHTAVQVQGKRKRDDASEPARGDQQTTKRFKPHDREGRLVQQSLTETAIHKVDISTEDEPRTVRANNPVIIVTKPTPEKAKELPTANEDTDEEDPDQHTEQQKELKEETQLEKYMALTGLYVDNNNASSQVVVLHDDDEVRVLTASTAPLTGRPIFHDTAGPIDISGAKARLAQLQSSQPVEPPFRKAGKHGRHGDFKNDPDRRTGRGHQLAPQDQIDLDGYYQFRRKVLAMYPRFPALSKGEVVHEEIKQVWNDGERWYNEFTERFSGFSVNHLWPCGCEKLRYESEDSESEAE